MGLNEETTKIPQEKDHISQKKLISNSMLHFISRKKKSVLEKWLLRKPHQGQLLVRKLDLMIYYMISWLFHFRLTYLSEVNFWERVKFQDTPIFRQIREMQMMSISLFAQFWSCKFSLSFNFAKLNSCNI